MLKRIRNRYVEMKLMHVGLNSAFWHPLDVLYVLTGQVWS
jgi:hypothetical protein